MLLIINFEQKKGLKFYWLYTSLALTFLACGDAEVAETTSVIPETTVVDTVPEVEEDPYPRLTSRNAVDFIRQFGKEHLETRVLIRTTLGDMKVKLYEGTPLHRANFIMLIKRGYFNNTFFYRVVKEFMIQGGNTDDEETRFKRDMIGAYDLPHEINEKYFHKRGALALSRDYDNNPLKLSDPYNFYIVQGKKFTSGELHILEVDYEKQFTSIQKNTYTTLGGAPHLDGEHTVFGEVYEGFEVIDKIAEVETDGINWPIKDIVINMEIIE